MGYPSGQAGPSEISVCSDVQVSPYLEASSSTPTPPSSLRQPPVAATETAAAQGLTIGPEEFKVKQKADELLKRIWTDEDEDPEVNTYHFNMLKRYYLRESPTEPAFNGSRVS